MGAAHEAIRLRQSTCPIDARPLAKPFKYNPPPLYPSEDHCRSYMFKYKGHNLAANRTHHLLQIVTTDVDLSLVYTISIVRIKSVQPSQ